MAKWAGPLLGVMILGCGGLIVVAPDLETPATWNGDGVRFDYPGNWSTAREQKHGEDGTLTMLVVQGSGSTRIEVYAYPDGMVPLAIDPLTATMLDQQDSVMSDAGGGIKDPTTVHRDRDIADVQAQGTRTTYLADLFGVELSYTHDVYRVEKGDRFVVVNAQVEDDDLAMEQPGIDLLIDTLAFTDRAGQPPGTVSPTAGG